MKLTDIIAQWSSLKGADPSLVTCRYCRHWSGVVKSIEDGVAEARLCDLEPWDIRTMVSDQAAIINGHDGGIYYGEDFCCIHFQLSPAVEEKGNETE